MFLYHRPQGIGMYCISISPPCYMNKDYLSERGFILRFVSHSVVQGYNLYILLGDHIHI